MRVTDLGNYLSVGTTKEMENIKLFFFSITCATFLWTWQTGCILTESHPGDNGRDEAFSVYRDTYRGSC